MLINVLLIGQQITPDKFNV